MTEPNKLLVTPLRDSAAPINKMLGPTWKVIYPGQQVSGKFDFILVSGLCSVEEPQSVFQDWLNDCLRCRLSSPAATLMFI